jgi:hypothetical protein
MKRASLMVPSYALVLVVVLACPLALRAEHAIIDLRVFYVDPATGLTKGQATAFADEDPPLGGVQPRPVMKVKANQPLVLQFIYTNTYPHGDVKGAAVRYFVVREEKLRQKTLPDLSKDVVTQGRFSLNFKPKSRVGARVEFTIPAPGIYLLRVQSENTNSDHEHFSAIDLQVE